METGTQCSQIFWSLFVSVLSDLDQGKKSARARGELLGNRTKRKENYLCFVALGKRSLSWISPYLEPQDYLSWNTT